MPLLASAPVVGIIDDSNNLVLSWTPVADTDGTYTRYNHWNITVDANVYRFPSSGGITIPPVTQTFTQTLNSGNHSITMQAFETSNNSTPLTAVWMTNGVPTSRAFPSPLSQLSVTFNLNSVLLGQTLTLTLDSAYTGADQWQIIWPDGTTTGWLPLSANVVAKAFSVPGAQNIVIQTRRDYSATQYNPPASLMRQTTKQIFVIDQQSAGTANQQGGLTGDLGIGGQQGFEITDASSAAVQPQPWEVIARALVRDTVTNELKLLIATTRFSNASSLLGTMAIDVFPIEGRPHSIELITPVFELTATANTETVPVKIQTSALPNIIVGKSITQALGGPLTLTVKDNTGIPPNLWSAIGLPSGVSMSSSGVINGTPLELGLFNVTFAVQDSSNPFSIDEITLPLLVETDLKVQIATGQKDANNTTLDPLGTTLGVAQVGTPYKVQMVVGNTNVNASTPGGLPPYTWSTPAGALPIGLSIDANTGVISGTPCTYNSTSDFSKTYTVIMQVTDAIGAKATQTYTMTIKPAALQFGPVDQSNIYSAQDFKLVVPVFGGRSPYTFNPGSDFQVSPSEASFFGTPALVDGQVEVVTDFPTTGTGTHTFSLRVLDSTPVSSGFIPTTFTVNTEISDIRIVPAFIDHVWAAGDAAHATPLPIVGGLSGYALAGTTLTLTSVANASGGSTIYTGIISPLVDSLGNLHDYAGQTLTIKGFSNAANNGVFVCSASTGTTLTLQNANGVAQSGTAKAILDLSPAPTNGIGVAIDKTIPEVNFTGPISVFRNSQIRVPLGLIQSTQTIGTISREYTLLSHNDVTNPGDIGFITSYARPYIAGDVVGLNPRKPYFNSPDVAAFDPQWTARVQSNSSLPPGLSLDANTGLIYGTLANVALLSSVIEYVDAGGTIHGTVTINWTTYKSDFQLIDNFNNADGWQIGTPLNGLAILGAPNGVTLSAPTVVAGTLPAGVSLAADITGSNVVLNGTPTEAGYFDLWLKVIGNGTQSGYVYHRLAIDYTKPMVILNSSLPAISSRPYSVTLQGFGGIPPYTWSSPQFQGAGTSPTHGVGTGVFAGLFLNTNPDNTATLTGTLTTPPGTSPTDLGNITFTLTDTRGPASSVSKALDLTYDNRLRIITPVVPTIVPGSDYGFTMSGAGGTPPYTWQIANSPTLPSGISFDAIQPTFGTTGAFSGITSVTGYDQFIGITIKDSLGGTSSGYNLSGNPFEIKTGTASLLIDSSLVGPINRGVPYQGTLKVVGTFTTPVSWQVAPTPTNPKTMLAGLTISPDASTGGETAIIAGTYLGVPHQTENIVKITGNGGGGTVTVVTKQSHGFLSGDSVTISGTTNFNGVFTITVTTTGSFSYTSTNSNPDEVSGLATDSTNLYSVRVIAVDANGLVAAALVPLTTSTDLTISTQSLPNATVGGTYNYTLTATGGLPPYIWSIDPISTDTLPGSPSTGLSLSGAGVITGTAIPPLFNKNITFRVTDANTLSGIPNIARAKLNLVSQASGLAITTSAITPATSGRAYSFQMQAAGSPNLPYTWTISPLTANQLPTGLSMNSSGVISGNTTLTGFNKPVAFRVIDSIGAFVDRTLVVSVVAGLTLKTGIDFADGTNTGILGYVAKGQVDSINPRPNLSFYVIANGVVSTSTSQIQVSVGNSNITGTVESITSGNALIRLTGSAFAAGQSGNNVLSISVTDSGVNVSGSFTWVVYDDGTLRVAPSSGNLPTQLTTP